MASLATVSIVFCDLVGSTELLSRVGDAAADELRRACFAAWRDVIERVRGVEVKSQGDGMMISFSSAVDAIEGAVGLQLATNALSTRHAKANLQLRVGISAGEAACEDGDWFGTPVVEAARLCAAAAPGEILATRLVVALVGSRTTRSYRDAGAYELKGLPSPVDAVAFEWQQDAASAVPLPRPLRRPPGSPFAFFVGREAELDRLERGRKHVVDGEPRCYFIAGEPGIGKTTLAAEAARRAHDDGALVMYGRCDQELAEAFQPFAEAFTTVFTTCSRSVIEGLDRGDLAELARIVPVLRDLVPDLPVRDPRDQEVERKALFDAVGRVLKELDTVRPPLVLVLDDLHWAAQPTLLLLRHLLMSPDPTSILVLVTYRDTDVGRGHPLSAMLADFRRAAVARRVPLRGFDRDENATFVAAAAGHDLDADQEPLLSAIYAATDGHPLFLREVLAHLAESGAIYQRDGRWVSDLNDVDLELLGLPEGVRDAISRRLSALTDTANEVLRTAAIVGTHFETKVLLRIPELASPDEDVLGAIADAEAAGVVIPGERPGAYQFSHALVRQTLIDEVPMARRTRLHRRIGEAMEALSDADSRVAELAYHFGQAAVDGVATKAADYAYAAAARALMRVAPEQALTYASAGLQALDLSGEREDGRRADLHLAMASADLGQMESARESARRAAGFARAAGDAYRLARAAFTLESMTLLGTENPGVEEMLHEALDGLDRLGAEAEPFRCIVTAHLVRYRNRTRGELVDAEVDEVLERARRTGDDEALANALDTAVTALFGHPDAVRCQALNDELYAVERRLAERRITSTLVAHRTWLGYTAEALNAKGVLALRRGHRDEFDDALADYLRSSWKWLEHEASAGVAFAALLDGEFEEAERIISNGLALDGERIGALNNFLAQFLVLRIQQGRLIEIRDALADAVEANPDLPTFETGLAMILAETGSVDEARQRARALVADDLARLPRDSTFPCSLHYLSHAVFALDASDLAEPLLKFVPSYRSQLLVLAEGLAPLGAAERCEAMLLTTLGRLEEAGAHFEAALTFERALRSPPFVAQTSVAYAEMLARRGAEGDRERAAALLDEAGSIAASIGMATVADHVARLR